VVSGKYGKAMDEPASELQEADFTRATREYGWFVIALLCVMALVVIKLHH
jgi:hypothetical protein